MSNLDDFTAAVNEDAAIIVIITGTLSNARVKVKSNKTVIGRDGASKSSSSLCASSASIRKGQANKILVMSVIALDNVGLDLGNSRNVIIRNLIIKNVKAENGDGIQILGASNIWVDHVEMSSSRNGGGFDGLIDITKGSNFVTVSWSYLHDHVSATEIFETCETKVKIESSSF